MQSTRTYLISKHGGEPRPSGVDVGATWPVHILHPAAVCTVSGCAYTRHSGNSRVAFVWCRGLRRSGRHNRAAEPSAGLFDSSRSPHARARHIARDISRDIILIAMRIVVNLSLLPPKHTQRRFVKVPFATRRTHQQQQLRLLPLPPQFPAQLLPRQRRRPRPREYSSQCTSSSKAVCDMACMLSFLLIPNCHCLRAFNAKACRSDSLRLWAKRCFIQVKHMTLRELISDHVMILHICYVQGLFVGGHCRSCGHGGG